MAEIATKQTQTPQPGTDPYDVNFCFQVRELENARVKLTPFIPSIHAEPFYQGSSPEIYRFLPFGPYPDAQSFVKDFIETRVHPDPAIIIYSIFDKTRPAPPSSFPSSDSSAIPYALAGVIGYLNARPTNLSIEIGFVMILPAFQRTHITTNAVGLLMLYALDLPSEGGLGLRRLQWQANDRNAASVGAARRMGFKPEAVLRWDRIVPGGRGKEHNGLPAREGDPFPGTHARDSAMLSLCWDDWKTERSRVLAIMDRRV
ncbi:hypothetical protein BJ138DRAFT_1122298 [Hygrophoropsis aurantiaca]|uniref:Uncharacterized protein n=1 Tax=Hygrophoropsis aurantiaca TaxID=72124 RepID=A0ACB8AR43_9AGAM|nr:hypothetical protein BJ138DRAFT_1122298 [Hygrophoropsis aurantiaca]